MASSRSREWPLRALTYSWRHRPLSTTYKIVVCVDAGRLPAGVSEDSAVRRRTEGALAGQERHDGGLGSSAEAGHAEPRRVSIIPLPRRRRPARRRAPAPAASGGRGRRPSPGCGTPSGRSPAASGVGRHQLGQGLVPVGPLPSVVFVLSGGIFHSA